MKRATIVFNPSVFSSISRLVRSRVSSLFTSSSTRKTGVLAEMERDSVIEVPRAHSRGVLDHAGQDPPCVVGLLLSLLATSSASSAAARFGLRGDRAGHLVDVDRHQAPP